MHLPPSMIGNGIYGRVCEHLTMRSVSCNLLHRNGRTKMTTQATLWDSTGQAALQSGVVVVVCTARVDVSALWPRKGTDPLFVQK